MTTLCLFINGEDLAERTDSQIKDLLTNNTQLKFDILLRVPELNNPEEPITPMLIENPAHKKALHLTLQNNSQAHISHLQEEFLQERLSYQEDQVYVNTQLSSIGETVLVRIPNLGYSAIPLIINLDKMNIPIFKRVLIAYEKNPNYVINIF